MPRFLSRPRALILRSAALLALAHAAGVRANTEFDVANGHTDLTAAATYTTGGASGTGVGGSPAASAPSSSSDVTFDSGITYSLAAFTVNSSLNIGTLNDLDATQTLSLSNAGTAADTLTLSGGVNSVTAAGSTSDLLYVATGGTLTVTGGTGATALGLAQGAAGNLDVAGVATVSSIVSGTNGLTKTGVGTLTLSGANTYTGGTTISAGTIAIGSDSNLGKVPSPAAVNVTLNGGTLQATASFTVSASRYIAVGSAGGTLNNTSGGNFLIGSSGSSTPAIVDMSGQAGVLDIAGNSNAASQVVLYTSSLATSR